MNTQYTQFKTMELEGTELGYGYPDYSSDIVRCGFMVKDILSLGEFEQDRIVELSYIYTPKEKRGQGNARALLEKFIKENENCIIVIQAAPLYREYPINPSREEYDKSLVMSGTFLEKFGFRNINALCGFEESVPYMYRNKFSEPYINKIIELEITGEIKD